MPALAALPLSSKASKRRADESHIHRLRNAYAATRKAKGLAAFAANPLIFMVAWGGIEPPTRGFSIRCSTN